MELVASAFLDPVCERVINTIIEEYGLVRNVEEELKKLRSTASLIKGVLQDAEDKQVKDKAIGEWLTSLKQILYDAEDILDEGTTDSTLQIRLAGGNSSVPSMRAKVRNIICCFGSLDKILIRHGLAHQIKAIRLKLDDMYKEKDGLGLQVLAGNSWTVDITSRRQPTSSLLADKSCIIGRDDEKKKIIQKLLGSGDESEPTSSNNNIHIIALVGMGGVGKTTLAKLVYNDETVRQHFQLCVWVCISEDFDLKRITKEIMDSIPNSSEEKELFEIFNWDSAQKRLRHKIEERRFLIVLDDMWEEDPAKWENLYEPLKYGGKGSRVMVTTRKRGVSDMVKAFPFFLKTLSSDDLWPVFKAYAFDGYDSTKHMQLETVGRQIVERLKGSPLAAKTIGRLLNKSSDVRHWKNILKSEIFTLEQHSDDISPVLQLSYNHLPGHLKRCFAYCSLFPKDYNFSKGELTQHWIAQQYYNPTLRGPRVESIRSGYFDDLLCMSLFEEENTYSGYVMHDLIHDLAESVSEDDCFRLGDDQHRKCPDTVRHLSVATRNLDPTKLKELCTHGNLRTLLFLRPCIFVLTHHLDDLFMKLKRLRVLGLQRCKILELPTSIGTLKHLRFVNLSSTLISKLPESFCDLQKLQVLMLQNCGLLRALPSNMSALINLRHLRARCELVSNIQGLRQLTALHELSISGRQVKELVDMGMLKELEICDLDQVEVGEEVVQGRLDTKEYLEVLKLTWDDDRDDHLVNQALDEEVLEGLKPENSIRELSIAGYGGLKSPSWVEDHSWASTSSLKIVKLKNCRKWEFLPALGQLPCLKTLEITGMHGVRQMGPYFFGCGGEGGSGGFKAQGFPSLEELMLSDMPEWEEWQQIPHVGDGDDRSVRQRPQQQPLFLPCLRILKMFKCPKLRELPPLPPTLTRLEISNVGLTRLPGWSGCHDVGGDFDGMPSLTSPAPSLSTLYIYDCPNIKSLGDGGLLQHPLPLLERLTISLCPQLASLPDRTFSHLTSLKSLRMTDCPKLSWPPSVAPEGDDALPPSLESVDLRHSGDMMAALLSVATLQKLTSLRYLGIGVGPPDQLAELRALTFLTQLKIHDDDGHLDAGALSTCLQGLTSLRTLRINNFSVMTSLPSVEVLSHLTALECLYINGCSELTSLGGAPALVSLEELSIENCPKLLHLVEAATSPMSSTLLCPPPPTEMAIHLKSLFIWQSSPQQIAMWLRQCPSLKRLSIVQCDNLICDNGGNDIERELDAALLNLAPSLRELGFFKCDNLSSLPSNLRFLSSLEELMIKDCPQIQSLPGAGLPESLDSLRITRCRALEERCKEGGTDWPLISHVPQVTFGW